jgi:hypothetical protein
VIFRIKTEKKVIGVVKPSLRNDIDETVTSPGNPLSKQNQDGPPQKSPKQRLPSPSPRREIDEPLTPQPKGLKDTRASPTPSQSPSPPKKELKENLDMTSYSKVISICIFNRIF